MRKATLLRESTASRPAFCRPRGQGCCHPSCSWSQPLQLAHSSPCPPLCPRHSGAQRAAVWTKGRAPAVAASKEFWRMRWRYSCPLGGHGCDGTGPASAARGPCASSIVCWSHTVSVGAGPGLCVPSREGKASLLSPGPSAFEHLCLSLGQAPSARSRIWLSLQWAVPPP